MKRREVGTFEYRLICADPSHRLHQHHVKGPRQKAEERAALANEDPVCDPATCVPANRTCRPWRIEARFVTEWTDQMDGLELAAAHLAPTPTLL